MLALCYLVHGGEPLQTEEIVASIKHIAEKEGYNKNMVFAVNAQFDWDELLNKCQNLDIFANKSLVDIRLLGDSPSKQANLALCKLLEQQSPDLCVIIRANKLTSKDLSANWVKILQQSGKIYTAKAIPKNKWLTWVTQRLKQSGFHPIPAVCAYIAKYYEGNLSAAAQCIQKLTMTLSPGTLSIEQIKPFLNHDHHFTVFDLSEATIQGDCERVFQILNYLQHAGIEPVLCLWALTKEIRTLLKLSYYLQAGNDLAHSMRNLGIWNDRVSDFKHALDRLPIITLIKLIKLAKATDLIIKGIRPGDPWEQLLSLCLMLASKKTLNMEELTR